MKNGQEIGREYLAALQSFIKHKREIPRTRDGSLNIAELSRMTGIPKSSFYQNSRVRSLADSLRNRPQLKAGLESDATLLPRPLEQRSDQASAQVVVSSAGLQQVEKMERRILALEQQNSALVAENSQLRKELKELRQQLGRQDMMIETGRRIVSPSENES